MTDFDSISTPPNLDSASAYDYDLPPHLIAQQPASPRDHARLMRLSRMSGALSHHRFDDLPALLRPDDLLILNDTRVLRARLRGYKSSFAAPSNASPQTVPPHEYSCGDNARNRDHSTEESRTAAQVQAPPNVEEASRGARVRGARVEALLLRELGRGLWEALLKPSARLRPGTPLCFESRDGLTRTFATPVERTASGWIVRFDEDLRALLPRLGEVPLPPYIEAALRDDAHYQTIYARGCDANADANASPQASNARDSLHMSTHAGHEYAGHESGARLESAAAPTAGLHFTPETFAALRARGIETAFVTLQIGVGTFRPMQSEHLDEHTMHEEHFEIPVATQRLITEQRARGGRIVAVGTTTTRVLEAASDGQGGVRCGVGKTDIFIRPGHRFAVVDALVTNFHLPRSTLLVMITAFAAQTRCAGATQNQTRIEPVSGLEKIRYAYSQAVIENYRFFSFGDAMLIE